MKPELEQAVKDLEKAIKDLKRNRKRCEALKPVVLKVSAPDGAK